VAVSLGVAPGVAGEPAHPVRIKAVIASVEMDAIFFIELPLPMPLVLPLNMSQV
jgi:hypothetical protein